MRLVTFDHVNIHTEDAGRLASWYERVLGMKPGPRPDFPGIDGIWLYTGDKAYLHLVEMQGVGRPDIPALEHFSFTAKGLTEFLNILSEIGAEYEFVEVPEVGLVQVNFCDCDGNHVHIDFPLDEHTA